MKKFKNWLYSFLPVWAKDTLLSENKKLKSEIEKLKSEIETQNAYIDGLENGIRSQRKIVINTGEAKK